MIAYLNGLVRECDEKTAVIETAGVGYRVKLSRFSLAALTVGAPAELRIHTEFPNGEIVLYGFLDRVEELLFAQLIGVPGVGGASALGILSAAPPQETAALIMRRDVKGLTALPRVGKKLAERLIVELADKLEKGGAGAAALPQGAGGGGSSLEADLASALINFGYQPREAREAISRALGSGVDPKEKGAFERLFRITLKELSGRV